MATTFEQLVGDVLRISPDKIVDSLTMKDAESWDSLKHMDLIASLEKTYGLEFTFDEIIAMTRVGAIRDTLRQKGAAV
jgi:acyl carrier protein